MNPNRLSRELCNLSGNIRSDHLPGGSIISAVLDRNLMTWSDRGGASRIFGEIWSEYCWELLSGESVSTDAHQPATPSKRVLRLDADPKIAIQAGRNQLPNPDFLIAQPDTDSLTVYAVDAKFAVDRLRRTQVSPESIRELVELPGSLVKTLILDELGEFGEQALEYEQGVFLGPNSLLNDYYYRKLTTGEAPQIPETELRLVSIDAETLFSKTAEFPLMRFLQAMDRLAAGSPTTEVVVGMYYLRLASAARWFETQSRMPLLALESPEPLSAEEIYEAATTRVSQGQSAYKMIHAWSETAEKMTDRQSQVKEAARLPVRMSEIRKLVESAGFTDDKKRVRMVRGSLERKFTRRLIEEVGEIPAHPQEPLTRVVERVRDTSKQLKPEMMKQAARLVDRFSDEAN